MMMGAGLVLNARFVVVDVVDFQRGDDKKTTDRGTYSMNSSKPRRKEKRSARAINLPLSNHRACGNTNRVRLGVVADKNEDPVSPKIKNILLQTQPFLITITGI